MKESENYDKIYKSEYILKITITSIYNHNDKFTLSID